MRVCSPPLQAVHLCSPDHTVTLRNCCVFQMTTMSDETEQRVCDEDFGSEEEGDVESYLEDNSSELMDRLRELEVQKHTVLK